MSQRQEKREDEPNKEQVVTERTSSLSFIPSVSCLSPSFGERYIDIRGEETTDTTRKKV